MNKSKIKNIKFTDSYVINFQTGIYTNNTKNKLTIKNRSQAVLLKIYFSDIFIRAEKI